MMGVAGIVFSCVAANHLGLVGAVETLVGKSLPIVNCPKCLTFWSVLLYMIIRTPITDALATAFLCAYAATWVELAMYFIDTQYMKLYGKISNHKAADGETTAAARGKRSKRALPEL